MFAAPAPVAGSSPLTRGKRERRPDQLIVDRLIPAHAGKTSSVQAAAPPMRAHPRSRGENSCESLMVSWVGGSSPLTRGKPTTSRKGSGPSRLIPAHAGKTRRARRYGRSVPAHPRSRGENAFRRPVVNHDVGSSPLTRGKRLRSRRTRAARRLIPAHAGKTAVSVAVWVSGSAHPRSRGENRATGSSARRGRGSSPLTRGKPLLDRAAKTRERLIPAHAGKTADHWIAILFTPAHPRSRGENGRPLDRHTLYSGSSPLTRGKQGRRGRGLRGYRLIPAHAGKTHPRWRPTAPESAHPRSRGENKMV